MSKLYNSEIERSKDLNPSSPSTLLSGETLEHDDYDEEANEVVPKRSRFTLYLLIQLSRTKLQPLHDRTSEVNAIEVSFQAKLFRPRK